MARPIDGDALKRWCEKIIDQACHPATVQIGEVFLEKVRSMPTLAPSNEPLICDGCLWAEMGALEKCSSCMRDKKDNYYRRPPEGEEEA